jgi:vacuolar protein sorting-associated protein 16
VVIEMWEKCGMRVKAAEEAVKARDVQAVDRLREAAGVGTVEGREIERLGAGLKR